MEKKKTNPVPSLIYNFNIIKGKRKQFFYFFIFILRHSFYFWDVPVGSCLQDLQEGRPRGCNNGKALKSRHECTKWLNFSMLFYYEISKKVRFVAFMFQSGNGEQKISLIWPHLLKSIWCCPLAFCLNYHICKCSSVFTFYTSFIAYCKSQSQTFSF